LEDIIKILEKHRDETQNKFQSLNQQRLTTENQLEILKEEVARSEGEHRGYVKLIQELKAEPKSKSKSK